MSRDGARRPGSVRRAMATPPPAAAVSRRRRAVVLAGAAVLSVAAYVLTPPDLGELGRRAVAIAVLAAILWATETLPLFVTSLAVIGLEVLLLASRDGGGGLAGTGDLSYTIFFEPFASSTIILFLGGFLLAAAVSKHGLDRAVAAHLLRPFVGGSFRLVLATVLTTGFLSIWVSNTAAAAMMLAIVTSLLRHETVAPALRSAVVLAVAFGASIGGFVTPVSTPPNAITISQLRAIGVHISFLEWVLMAAPLAAVMLVITGVLLYVVLRPPPATGIAAIEPPGALSGRARATSVVLLATVLAWLSGPWHGVADSAVALIAATVLAVIGLLDRRDVRSIDWDVLLLMWGGLALGNGLRVTGVLEYVGSAEWLADLHGWPLALVVITGGMLFATFMSNTAAANVLVPLSIALASGSEAGAADGEPARLAVLTGLTVSFSVSLPVSTPPNAMAYATGMVSSRDMVRVGLLVSLIAMGMLMAGYFVVLPSVLG